MGAGEVSTIPGVMKFPEVSVVMSVYNGAKDLPATLQSVLDQQGCSFEFIVVNDGSADVSGRILDEWAAQDARLRVIHQANAGLTRALIRGCAEARGEFIARQDNGDVSLPGRLVRQVALLKARLDAVAVSCHTRFIGPEGEALYESSVAADELNAALKGRDEGGLIGPSHHGSVMMRRGAYQAAGGYRAPFYFAQDIDLWTRLVEKGPFTVVPEALYEARVEPGSISGTQTEEQRILAGLIARAAQARRAGEAEDAILAAAAQVRPVHKAGRARREALGNYFIGSCLRNANPRAAATYFERALASDPWLWRARFRWLQTRMAGLTR